MQICDIFEIIVSLNYHILSERRKDCNVATDKRKRMCLLLRKAQVHIRLGFVTIHVSKIKHFLYLLSITDFDNSIFVSPNVPLELIFIFIKWIFGFTFIQSTKRQ